MPTPPRIPDRYVDLSEVLDTLVATAHAAQECAALVILAFDKGKPVDRRHPKQSENVRRAANRLRTELSMMLATLQGHAQPQPTAMAKKKHDEKGGANHVHKR